MYSTYNNIFTFYPDFISKWGEYNATLSVYDKSLEQVLYLSKDGTVEWDLINQQSINIFEDSPDNITSRPVWAPDGENFIIDLTTSTGRNLFLVSKSGQERQLTHLVARKSGDFINLAWSPNGRSIAFWLFTGKESHGINFYYDLTMLDLTSNTLKNFCITAYTWQSTYPDTYPIWSMDGENLLVAVQDPTDPQRSWSVVIDIADNLAYKVADNSIPKGWMKAP